MSLNKQYPYDFSIIGGDKRQVYIAESLVEKCHKVIVYAIDSDEIPAGCDQAENFSQTILLAKDIIMPIPMLSNNGGILYNTEHTDLKLGTLKQNISKGQRLFAGCIPFDISSFLEENGVEYFDFMEEDTIAIFNSIATAEGIIAEAVIKNPINLHGSNSLILGYGRCGRTLADKLGKLSVNTTVCVRNAKQKALANANGHETVYLKELLNQIGKFDFIYNTIPAVILGKRFLKEMKPTVMIFDIASSPGGVDYSIAKKLGIEANIYPSLPGKYAAKSTAIALADFIMSHQVTEEME